MKLAPDFEITLSEKSDSELCDMIARPEDYVPDAIDLARKELGRRALTADGLAQLQSMSHSRRETERQRAEQPLGGLVKALVLITGLIPAIIFVYRYETHGFAGKAGEVWKWLCLRYAVLAFLALWYALIQ